MLGYTVYATSFFRLIDQEKFVDKLIYPQDIESFNLKVLEDLSLNYVDEVDYIIYTSDINIDRFPKSKIIGNKNTKDIINKYTMYKKLYKNFLMPKTYKLNSIEEAKEIVHNCPDKRFLVKPLIGTGGVGIHDFSDDIEVDFPFILQEFIEGDSVSSSFLSYDNHDIDMVTTSDQIIGSSMLGASEYIYCGNITPLVNSNPKLINISTKISKMFKLVGSNGIDFILRNNNVYVIEVNPRIQGTFECIEKSFNLNLAEAHINSTKGIKVNIPKVEKFTVKLVPYSLNDSTYNLHDMSNMTDISPDNFLIKKGYPISTIIVSDRILENAMIKAEIIRKKVYEN